MAYVGNTHGPRKSEIVERLGPEYFGITGADLEAEIGLYEGDELRGEVDPVRKDKQGRYYLRFRAPGGGGQRFYLDEHGYSIPGKVKIWEESESAVEAKRNEE